MTTQNNQFEIIVFVNQVAQKWANNTHRNGHGLASQYIQ